MDKYRLSIHLRVGVLPKSLPLYELFPYLIHSPAPFSVYLVVLAFKHVKISFILYVLFYDFFIIGIQIFIHNDTLLYLSFIFHWYIIFRLSNATMDILSCVSFPRRLRYNCQIKTVRIYTIFCDAVVHI